MVDMAEMSIRVEVDKSHAWGYLFHFPHLHATGECLTGQLCEEQLTWISQIGSAVGRTVMCLAA